MRRGPEDMLIACEEQAEKEADIKERFTALVQRLKAASLRIKKGKQAGEFVPTPLAYFIAKHQFQLLEQERHIALVEAQDAHARLIKRLASFRFHGMVRSYKQVAEKKRIIIGIRAMEIEIARIKLSGSDLSIAQMFGCSKTAISYMRDYVEEVAADVMPKLVEDVSGKHIKSKAIAWQETFL